MFEVLLRWTGGVRRAGTGSPVQYVHRADLEESSSELKVMNRTWSAPETGP